MAQPQALLYRRTDPFAHFAGGFLSKGNCQERRRLTSLVGVSIRHQQAQVAFDKDTGFATARARCHHDMPIQINGLLLCGRELHRWFLCYSVAGVG